MSKPERKKWSAQEKVLILREHLIDQVPSPTICERYGIAPSMLYRWQKQFFENGAAAFNGPQIRNGERKLQAKIDKLEDVVKRKNEVIAEISEEYVQVKKELGGL